MKSESELSFCFCLFVCLLREVGSTGEGLSRIKVSPSPSSLSAPVQELLQKLKKDGYKLYIASNMDLLHAAQMREHPIVKYFDKMVFSAEIKVGKPKAEYFVTLLDICGEKAENSLFIDDLSDNVKAAEALGIKGLVFKGDAKEAEKFIYEN